jgi:hypothetical protein
MLVGAVPATANFSNGPGSAGIVDRFDDPGFGVWFDDGLIVAANVNSIADLCNGIPAGAGNVQEVHLPGGVLVSLLHDDDVPLLVFPDGDPEVICADPDEWPLIATGVGDVRGIDNDVFVSGTRTNVFGTRVNGSVVDGDGGAWSLQVMFRGKINKDGDFKLIREDINLVSRG